MPTLAGDRRVASALEFALVSPALVLLLFLAIETAWQLTVEMALNIGIIAGSRYAVTGAGLSNGTRDSTILATIISGSGGVLSAANLTLATISYASPASFASGGGGASSTGSSAQLVFYAVTYQQKFLTPLPAAILGYGAINHTARLIVQNEPFY